jgi:hypothetical protein
MSIAECVQTMALKLDWSSLDHRAFYVMKGDGFIINNYGHPSFVRYIEDKRVLTLSYEYADETAQRGRRFLVFRNYAIHLQVPTELAWDDGTAVTDSEAPIVLDRICQTLTQYKKQPCSVVVDNRLYEQIEAGQRARRERRRDSSRVTGG